MAWCSRAAMHQTAVTSFLARRGLGFGLRVVRVNGFGVARLVVLDGGAAVDATIAFFAGFFVLDVERIGVAWSAWRAAILASLIRRFLRLCRHSFGFIASSSLSSTGSFPPNDFVVVIMTRVSQSLPSRSRAHASTAILRASATAVFFFRVVCLPQIRS